MRGARIDNNGHIFVRNLSAYWIPEIRIVRDINGTVYTVTGSYEGSELSVPKIARIMLKNMEDAK